MTEEENKEKDPYALSSSDSEDERGPPPKIPIDSRAADIGQLKEALNAEKEPVKDTDREEEIKELMAAVAKDVGQFRENFETGKVGMDAEVGDRGAHFDREQIQLDKAQYSELKNKFENMDETSDQQNVEEKVIVGAGAEQLQQTKTLFEKPPEDAIVHRQELVTFERSQADKKRVERMFHQQKEEPNGKDCAICGKTVYPVEKVCANKRLYHNACFRCSKCAKTLTPTNYNSHEGALLCKVHMLEVFHPELAKNMDPSQTEEDEHELDEQQEEEDEFAVVSRPRQLESGVVRSGLKSADDLKNVSSLREKRGDWEASVQESQKTERLTQLDQDIFEKGRVKGFSTRYMGEGDDGTNEEDEDEGINRDPNVVRENKRCKKEQLHFEQVDEVKNKWKTGNVETGTVQATTEDRVSELDQLKKGPKVKERFQERTVQEHEPPQSFLDKETIDTSMSSEARKAFVEGAAYEQGPVKRTVEDDVKCAQLDDIKAAFESAKDDSEMTPDERAELKKKEIEEEFNRYKLARRKQELHDERERQEVGVDERADDGSLEVRTSAEMGAIKDRFEKGIVSAETAKTRPEAELEIRMARKKFKEIDAEGAVPLLPSQQHKIESKWNREKDINVSEAIYKRDVDEDFEDDEDEAFQVKALREKFQKFEMGETEENWERKEKELELEALAVEAKELKARFEQAATEDVQQLAETSEQKKKRLDDEFRRYKEQKEFEMQNAQPEEAVLEDTVQEETNVVPEHAAKMTAKWEKIQKKEAKKAEKAKMPQKG